MRQIWGKTQAVATGERRSVGIIVSAGEDAVDVTAAVEEPQDDDFSLGYGENDRYAPFEARRSQAWKEVVTPRASLGKEIKSVAVGSDARRVTQSHADAGLVSDPLSYFRQIVFRVLVEDNLVSHSALASRAFSRASRRSKTSSTGMTLVGSAR